jgi:DNA replication and repair protein RecF
VPLKLVRIRDFRCIEQAELTLSRQRTYIYGPNGAGKTSLLEAAYLLGRGRSFRTRHNRLLVRHGQVGMAVYGEVQRNGGHHRLGLQLGESGLETRVDGSTSGGVAALARLLPINVIEPNIHQLIEGAPSTRRRFLDWGVFHVERRFLEDWQRYRRVLGQRNAGLKLGQDTSIWDTGLVEAGEAVHAARRRYFELLEKTVAELGVSLVGQPIQLSYRGGWAAEIPLAEALRRSRQRDRHLASTQVGPHRADLRVAVGDRAVREAASRGQQKLVAAAMVVGQTRVFADAHGDAGTLLVDDPAAELDSGSFRRLMDVLDGLPAQLIMTGLSEATLPPAGGFPVFHVEQGKVSPVL